MLSIYANLSKTKTWQTEKRGSIFTIVERDYMGNVLGKIGEYKTRDAAEKDLAILADDSGFRWIGRQDNAAV